ncbi:MAG: hypothetical protein K2Q17_07385 [Nitrospiraceae bacterium]|nr:hypothetical protein [Nitrospiraceae bacterium]
MRTPTHALFSVLACTLVVLFFALSFNAHACLLPMNGTTAGMGCSTSDEHQFCDAFKTLGLECSDKFPLTSDCQTLRSEDTVPLPLLINLISNRNLLSDHPTVGLPKDLLLEISVLRI